MHVFGQWEEAREPREHQHLNGKSMHTPHTKAQAKTWTVRPRFTVEEEQIEKAISKHLKKASAAETETYGPSAELKRKHCCRDNTNGRAKDSSM